MMKRQKQTGRCSFERGPLFFAEASYRTGQHVDGAKKDLRSQGVDAGAITNRVPMATWEC